MDWLSQFSSTPNLRCSFYSQKCSTIPPAIEQLPDIPFLVGVTSVLMTHDQTPVHTNRIVAAVFQSLLNIPKSQVSDNLSY